MEKSMMPFEYRGFTYPTLFGWKPLRWLWRRTLCPRQIHQFDECLSSIQHPDFEYRRLDHYLVCDACRVTVRISSIEDCA